MMLDTMSELNPAIPWQDSNTLISETIRLCFTFWVLFSYGLAGVHKRLPWPPPVPLERLLSMLCCLLDGHIVISNSVTVFCWTHCIELLGSYHKHIQSLSLALQKADFILSNELQWLFLWPSPQIRVTILHFDAAKKAIDKLQLRSNILDFTDEQQADCTDLKFIEARYNTKLKNVLLSDCALACGPSRCSEVKSLIHTKLGNACSYFLDDRHEIDKHPVPFEGRIKVQQCNNSHKTKEDSVQCRTYLDMDFRSASIQKFLCFPKGLGRLINEWPALSTFEADGKPFDCENCWLGV